ncbi:YetF domain-containing protein [Mobiluncus mulieris]|uniref:YetF domain-containing protein n=1 Tax=Mobiluncus mulieris TaxID=2052 RepID=UPI000DFD6516|nr:YetF domain-containing protein [Mobiluncus mulieris]STY84117.1 Protein of uncharacterised function (DUF421) [Mobiluncus mulieris]
MSFWEQLWYQIGLSPAQALGVVIASVVIYLVISAIIQLWGRRIYANHSATGLAVTLVVGSISARAMLGNSPTLFGWAIAITVVLVLESILGMRFALGWKRRPRQAVIIYARDCFDEALLRRYHLSRGQIRSSLREKGLASLAGVGMILLEPSGHLSVIKEGAVLAGELAQDIRDPKGVL